MPECPVCREIASITARALNGGDLHLEMVKIAGMVKPENLKKDAEAPKAKPEPKEFHPEVERLYKLFVELQGKEPKGIQRITAWKDAIRLMKHWDKTPYKRIEEMIRWVSQDVCERGSWRGWKYVILSLPKMRQKSAYILDQMPRSANNSLGGSGRTLKGDFQF